MTRTDRRLAWIILAILGGAGLLGFGRGLSQALSDVPSHRSDGGAIFSGREPRTATALPLIDEARVRQIAREEAEAAVARARPKRPPPPKAPKPDADESDTPDPVGAIISASPGAVSSAPERGPSETPRP